MCVLLQIAFEHREVLLKIGFETLYCLYLQAIFFRIHFILIFFYQITQSISYFSFVAGLLVHLT
jgi:hypothetical protein